MIKQDLINYKYLREDIANTEEEIIKTRTRLESPAVQKLSLVNVKNKNYDDKISKITAEIVDMLTELEEMLVLQRQEKKRILQVIRKLPSKHYILIKKYYIMGKNWETVAKEMKYHTKSISRLHKEALEILFEK